MNAVKVLARRFQKVFQSRSPEEPTEVITSTAYYYRLTKIYVVTSSLIFLSLALVVPLDEGVPTPALTVVDSKRIPIQHPTGGIIKKAHVTEGQFVEAGSILIEFDEQASIANFEKANSTLRNIELSIDAQEKLITDMKAIQASRRTQLRLAEERLSGLKSLMIDGFATVDQYNDQQTRVAELTVLVASSQSELVRAVNQLSDFKNSANSAREVMKLAKEEKDRGIILAPLSGQIINLKVQAERAVVTSGQVLMELVPQKPELVLEAKISPTFIDRVNVGDLVSAKFSLFSHSPLLSIEAQVISVSSDITVETPNSPPYYLVRAQLTEDGKKQLGTRTMHAGMPAEVVIISERRTLAAYIFSPFLRRIQSALVEQ
jgi:multidrug resistance efflux pump